MDALQIQRVRQSFAAVAPIRQAAARLFYTRLFEIAPDVRPMFRGDLAAQGDKLFAALAAIVATLDDLRPIDGYIVGLAQRHRTYGVRPRHYVSVGMALVWALEKGLGDAFTAEVRESWLAAYNRLSVRMIEASALAA